jgi:hypothetical protein
MRHDVAVVIIKVVSEPARGGAAVAAGPCERRMLTLYRAREGCAKSPALTIG